MKVRVKKRAGMRSVLRSVGLLAALSVVIVSCGSGSADGSGSSTDSTPNEGSAQQNEVPDGPTIVIGAQDFGESAILAEVYGQALSDAGYPVEQQPVGGFRDVLFGAIDAGEVNFAPEYLASSLEFLNEKSGEASKDVDASVEFYTEALAEKSLQPLDPAPGQNSDSFVVPSDSALTKVSELTPDLRLGGPADCLENPHCVAGIKETYGIDLSENFVPLDGGGPLTVTALEEGEVDVAVLFSTDALIKVKDFKVLEDDKGLIEAENIIPIVTSEMVEAYGEDFVTLVNSISAKLETEVLIELNRQFSVDKDDAEDVATKWLTENGFLA